MIKPKVLSIAATLGVGFMLGVGMLVPRAAWAHTVALYDEISIDGEILDICNDEGISDEACACWLMSIHEDLEIDELTLSDIGEIAAYYGEELGVCIEIND